MLTRRFASVLVVAVYVAVDSGASRVAAQQAAGAASKGVPAGTFSRDPLSLRADPPPPGASGGAKTPAPAPKEESGEDPVTKRQSVDTFISLEDGQPGAPCEQAIQLNAGWLTRSGERDVFTLNPEYQWTPGGSDFLDNLQLTVGVPMELGLGAVDGNADLELGWQQRWVKDNGTMPTLSTLVELRLPTGYQSSGVDARLTGIVAKDVGPITLYFNGWGESANGNNEEDLRYFQWGFRLGAKWVIDDTWSLVGDYVNQSSEQTGHANLNLLEVAAEYHVSEALTIGPGAS